MNCLGKGPSGVVALGVAHYPMESVGYGHLVTYMEESVGVDLHSEDERRNSVGEVGVQPAAVDGGEAGGEVVGHDVMVRS